MERRKTLDPLTICSEWLEGFTAMLTPFSRKLSGENLSKFQEWYHTFIHIPSSNPSIYDPPEHYKLFIRIFVPHPPFPFLQFIHFSLVHEDLPSLGAIANPP